MKKFSLALIVGVLLTWLWFTYSDRLFAETYVVKSIQSHYPHGDQNSQTTLIVYLNGNSGHTKEILCAFPPSLQLVGSNDSGWSGIRKVRIWGEAERFMYGKVSYYAEKVE